MNPIQAAEDALAQCAKGFFHHPGQDNLRESLETLLTHACTLEAELARLREPLGDGAELVERLLDMAGGMQSDFDHGEQLDFDEMLDALKLLSETAAFITRQSAEIAELRAAIKQGAEWFREYEAGHQAQADAEDHRTRKADRQDKANRNRDRAEFLERALAAQDGGA